MNRNQFEDNGKERWLNLETMLDTIEGSTHAGKIKEKLADFSPEEEAELPERFRQLCSDYALAQHRMYGMNLCDRLNALVMRGYTSLHKEAMNFSARALKFLIVTFPQSVRRDWKMFWLCMALFWLPGVAMFASVFVNPLWVQALLGPESLASMEEMYGNQNTGDVLREEYGSDFMMFGYYIYHNIGIDFRMFAGGIAAGVLTLFFLVFNGLAIGASAGYVQYACNADRFWSFVSGHAAFELTGIIIAAMSGLHLGLAILKPGRLRRKWALLERVKKSVVYLFGAGTLTFLAAIVEGFWSASTVDASTKYVVGAVMWVLVFSYLYFCGRRAAPIES
jgi:uncharacterized membrane protein SpoIIM required for sporulation